MKTRRLATKVIMLGTALVALAPARAAVITSLANGTSLPIPIANIQGAPGPIGFGPGVTFETSSPTARFGWTSAISQFQAFPWAGTPAIGLNNIESAFSLTFDSPIKAFLGQITWGTSGYAGFSTRMSAYDATGEQLDYIDFMASGVQQYMPRQYYGFSYAGADIKRIVFTNDFIAIRNLSFVPGAVPEAATWLTMIIGFGMIGGALRRRRACRMELN